MGPARADEPAAHAAPDPGPEPSAAGPEDEVAELSLGREQQSVPQARHFVEDLLRRWDLADLVDAAALVCSELTTNALLHGAPPVHLVVRRRPAGVRLELHDRRRSDPVLARQRLLSTQGRGMAMVAMLASSWGVEGTPSGKAVWAEIGAEPEPDDDVPLEVLEALWGVGEVLDEQPALPAADGPARPAADAVAELASLVAGTADGHSVAELRARVMVDHMYQFVGLLTAEGVLIDVNVPALVGGGLRPEDVLGRLFWECAWWQVSATTVRDVREAVRSAAQGQEVRYDVEVWGGAAGSQLITIEFSCRPIRTSGGAIPFLVVEGRDITEKKRAELELAAAVEQLEAANRRLTELDTLRREFVANVSHELRTPLTIILSGADRLLRDPAAARGAPDLNRIRDAGVVLLKRVNDLLTAAALEQQRELRLRDVDLAASARAVTAQYEGLAADRGQALLVAAGEPCVVTVDADLVESLLSNLVGNAVKFTPEGGTVRVSVQRWGERVLLEVADSGPGIPVQLRAAVLEPFRQVEGAATRRHEGTGLGLAIAAQVVARHNGEIALSDAPEGGALVTVTLPSSGADALGAHEPEPSEALLADVDALRAELKRPTDVPAAAAAGRPRVLVAEDNVDLGDHLVELLGSRYDVTLARDGAQALALLQETPPDLVLSDVMMPGVSGVELLARTRSEPRLAGVRVVLLTAKADPQLRVAALRGGAADYLVKPFDPAELLARLDNLLRT